MTPSHELDKEEIRHFGNGCRPSQRYGFYENALLEVGTESSICQHFHRASEQLLQVLFEGDHVEERPATLDLDEDVDIAIGSSVSANR